MLELTLPTMTCGHCSRAVTEAVHGVDAAAKVEIDLNTHRVRIDSQAEPAQLTAALAEAGYEPA
jgi:copper chaperone